jgi:hypothetical protein
MGEGYSTRPGLNSGLAGDDAKEVTALRLGEGDREGDRERGCGLCTVCTVWCRDKEALPCLCGELLAPSDDRGWLRDRPLGLALGEEADRGAGRLVLPPALLPWMLGGGVRSKKALPAAEAGVLAADRAPMR